MYANTYVADHFGHNDTREDIRYEAGSASTAVGNTECRTKLVITVDPAATVKVGVNGLRKESEQ